MTPTRKKKLKCIEDAKPLAEKEPEQFTVTEADEKSAGAHLANQPAEVYAKRRTAIETLMSFGHVQRDIVHVMTRPPFNMGSAQVHLVITRTHKKWAALDQVPQHTLKQQAVARLKSHITRASSKGQMSAAVAAENLLMKIHGLEAPKRIEVTINIEERNQQALMRAFQLVTPERRRLMAFAGAERRRLLQVARNNGEYILDAEFTVSDNEKEENDDE